MFSGIVETTGVIKDAFQRDGVLVCEVSRPSEFDDLKIGDSIAVDGVCLTLEQFSSESLLFALGPETLRVTHWSMENLVGKTVNLERSLRLNDRIHGHLVTGHVDGLGVIRALEPMGETLKLTIGTPSHLQVFIWSKGSVAINGVSLTVNACSPDEFQVGLIPETLKRTNLGLLTKNSCVNLEIDNMARGLVHVLNLQKELKS